MSIGEQVLLDVLVGITGPRPRHLNSVSGSAGRWLQDTGPCALVSLDDRSGLLNLLSCSRTVSIYEVSELFKAV
jgi:hypothetical protein